MVRRITIKYIKDHCLRLGKVLSFPLYAMHQRRCINYANNRINTEKRTYARSVTRFAFFSRYEKKVREKKVFAVCHYPIWHK